jgi:hypothetical protein
MRLRNHVLDDVDVDSCLANLSRIESIGSTRVVVDLTAADAAGELRQEDAPHAARRQQPLTVAAGDQR